MIVKQYFEVLSNERHIGEYVLLRVHREIEGITRREWSNEFKARIKEICSDGRITLIFERGGVLTVERDSIKLMR
jgi:hypothetical protein